MIPKSFPTNTTPLHQPPLIFQTKIPHICHHQHKLHTPINLSAFCFERNRHGKRRTRLPLAPASKGSDDGDNRAVDTVLKLYEAIKNKNLNEMSEIIGHDCLCVCNFVSMFKTFSGKQQVMKFFTYLMGTLGDKFEFIVKPTLHDGMTVGISWKLECKKTHKPIGTGFSFHICHVYQGKVLIRNVEMFLEPFVHIDNHGLKMAGLVANIIGEMASQTILKGERKKAAYVLCSLVTLALLLFIIRKTYRS
ncbi:uncharacterized protein LOC110916094 [Helianthus annuus]|uniref:uncharacterized protein LOC110916094 n=1 Tax=Helianthus annuus TaxID=4232 RepID=UPI001652C5A0|nr:uncharacterized protein LOC110916094 [Helianthus annuus]